MGTVNGQSIQYQLLSLPLYFVGQCKRLFSLTSLSPLPPEEAGVREIIITPP